jgi:meso-butanediol dehydrogenase/(S,S)-butanediol dehydrogenase/diacetyl reductase
MSEAGNGSVAVVTGSAGGIGRATVERLHGHGWKVVAVDRDVDRLRWTDGAADIVACAGDIATAESNDRMVAVAMESFGRLDAAVLNAGVSKGTPFDAFDLDSFDEMMAVNVRGTVLGIHSALAGLRASDGGAICVNSSLLGVAGDAGFWNYAAGKHALIGIVRSLARELGCEGIRINAVCPAATRTPMSEGIETAAPEVYAQIGRAIPLQRWSEADEIAAAIEFLVSPDASYINGVALPVDGGTSAGSGLLPPFTTRMPAG